MRTEIQRPIVFLDTNVLLKAFSAYRKERQLYSYMIDSSASRFTFEKCVFEAYMAFRGVGGKKPDEGRGRWAQSNFKEPGDPAPMSSLISKFHDGDAYSAYFWTNQILELECILDEREERIRSWVCPDGWERAFEEAEKLGELREQRRLFDVLCNNFGQMLGEHQVTILPYMSVFGESDSRLESTRFYASPRLLDGLARDMVIPSEDFEIVYAAIRLNADLFVTDDARLRKCARSLGLNLPLSPEALCASSEYETKVREWRIGNGNSEEAK